MKITIAYIPNEAEEAEHIASALRSRYGYPRIKKTADYNPKRHIYINVPESIIYKLYPQKY